MRNLVAYYSRKGSNEYLARKIASRLSCDLEEIRPRANAFVFFMLNVNLGIRPLKKRIGDYDRVILVGPVFMGRFIPPLRSFVARYQPRIRELVFVTCCGSTYEKKYDKFGHGLVFKEVERMMNGKLSLSLAFPVGLVLPEDQREDPDAFMKAHLDDSTFRGEIRDRFEDFMQQLDHPVIHEEA